VTVSDPPARWDCIVVGAGPAGLSAAIYMARFRRRTLVLDDGRGRWTYGQRNDNYLGFPRGVSALRLQRLGSAQAARFGASFAAATIQKVRRSSAGFELTSAEGERWRARTLIWATGVVDHWPAFPGAKRLVGKRLFWCIVCDGWRTRDVPILLVGDDDRDVNTALQFLTYTRQVTFLVAPSGARPSPRALRRLESNRVAVTEGSIRRVEGVTGEVLAGDESSRLTVRLRDGRGLEVSYLFGLLGSRPRTRALSKLGVEFDDRGCIVTDEKCVTPIAGFFAAGDVTNQHSHQVIAAAHEGSMAAVEANMWLYRKRSQTERRS
jgi:thioredoxin reductase (NADPH)